MIVGYSSDINEVFFCRLFSEEDEVMADIILDIIDLIDYWYCEPVMKVLTNVILLMTPLIPIVY